MNNNQPKKNNVAAIEPKKKAHRSKTAKTALIGIVLGLFASAIVGLSVALFYADRALSAHENYQRQMDAVYSRAYYDLMDGASSLGINLRKIGISNSPTMQQSLLYEVWSASSLAENSLGMFESQDDGILKAQKFVNQLGDYSHTLAKRVADGRPLTSEERQKLIEMGNMADMYAKALERAGENLKDGRFTGEDGALSSFSQAFSEFSEPSFAYPEMIYDGPFSDALENKSQKAMLGEEISKEKGEALLAEYFEDYVISNVRYAGECDGDINTLDYTFDMEGKKGYAQLGRRGGALVSYSLAGENMSAGGSGEADRECTSIALDFVRKLGFENMSVVWSSSADGECCINLAPTQDGVILYSDLVKVKVGEDEGKVIGLDATHYAYNHRERSIQAPAISEAQARQNLSIEASSEGKLALIPLKSEREVLTYEFECEKDGTYFVYVDAMSGDEVNILYVIDSEEVGMRTI